MYVNRFFSSRFIPTDIESIACRRCEGKARLIRREPPTKITWRRRKPSLDTGIVMPLACLLWARIGNNVGGFKSPESASPPTQIIEGIQRRTNLLTEFRYRIDVLEHVN